MIRIVALLIVIVPFAAWGYDAPALYGGCGENPCYTIFDEDVWVILGDSITYAQLYSAYIEAFFHLRYPAYNIHFRGEGRGGSVITEVTTEDRYGRRVYAWHPDIVLGMFGHNHNADTGATFNAKYQVMIDDYIVGLNSAVAVLVGPHPSYVSDGKPLLGDFADEVISIGVAENRPYAEVWDYMQPIFAANIADPTPVDLGYDGDTIHPGAAGHLIIAYTILSQLGVDGTVSAATIDAATPSVLSQTECTISGLSQTASGIDFTRLDTRLPWCWDSAAAAAIELMPNFWDMSQYMLTVTGLASGNYQIYIDGELSATVSSAQLAAGYNMAQMTSGPIYDQLQEVLGRIRDKEGHDRTTFERYTSPYSGIWLYKNAADTGYGTGLRGEDLRSYLSTHITNANALDDLIYAAAAPASRSFSLRLMPNHMRSKPLLP